MIQREEEIIPVKRRFESLRRCLKLQETGKKIIHEKKYKTFETHMESRTTSRIKNKTKHKRYIKKNRIKNHKRNQIPQTTKSQTTQTESNSLQEVLEAPGIVGYLVDFLVPVRPSLVKHCAEDVVARAQNKGVGGYPLVEAPIAHQEDDVTALLVLVKAVSSVEEKGQLVKGRWRHRAELLRGKIENRGSVRGKRENRVKELSYREDGMQRKGISYREQSKGVG